MAEKKEKSEHEKSQKEDEKIEQTLKRYAEENAQIVERSQKRKEERAKREKEFHERKLVGFWFLPFFSQNDSQLFQISLRAKKSMETLFQLSGFTGISPVHAK